MFVGYIFVTREFGVENIEAGLQMSYNLCNLPTQITTVNGKTVKYTYFADGTKFKAVDAVGSGFVYTSSLRWSVENGALVPESIAITGGRAVCDSTNMWSANYYITDHLGSVRAVTDAEGEVLDTFDYMPYGSEISSTSSTTTDYRFTGKERQSMVNNSIYDSFARFQNTYGRFMSIDPKAESFYHISPYTYCAGDPVNLVDPDGDIPIIPILWAAYEVGSAIYDVYTTYSTLVDENATTKDKIIAAGGLVASAFLPGGGYSAISKADDVFRVSKTADKITDGAKAYRSFTSSNFRENLARRTGKNPAGYEAHHMLPQKFSEQFSKAGIDIHDPQYGIWLEKTKHSKGSYRYNVEWDEFFQHNSNPTKKEVKDKMKQIMNEVYEIKIE